MPIVANAMGYVGTGGTGGHIDLTLTIQRDRAESFDPQLIAGYRRLPDFDNKMGSTDRRT
ncbi:MAG: hypothetical protein EOS86_32590 [Mesorhizobium sp.]|nr:MAG: hypothetical protein EOR95_33455 [Mesorhizobium sp.]RWQ61937.1 MAG: hypothetical protein EOS86_32590 [Mesorhizobium sp.]